MAIPYLDIVTQQYRLAGVLRGPGRGLSESEQAEGLHINNAMLDGLKIRRCFVYQVLRTPMPLTVNKQDYSVGRLEDGADWAIERPERIYRAGFIVGGGNNAVEIPIEVLIDYTQWQSLVAKVVPAQQPRVLYYRASLPTGTATIWPIPAVNGSMIIYTPGIIDEVSDINAQVDLPKGYRRLLEYVGACEVHDRYPDIQMLPGVEVRAREYMSDVMAAQFTPGLIRCDEGALQGKPDSRRWFDARTWVP